MNGFQFPCLILYSSPDILQHKNQNKTKTTFKQANSLAFQIYFSFNKPAEHNPPFFQFSCSIFTITSVLITETSGPLTSSTSFSSISLPLPPSPSFFCLELMAHHFNHSLAIILKYLALLPGKTLTLDHVKELFHFYTSATSEDNKLTRIAQ